MLIRNRQELSDFSTHHDPKNRVSGSSDDRPIFAPNHPIGRSSIAISHALESPDATAEIVRNRPTTGAVDDRSAGACNETTEEAKKLAKGYRATASHLLAGSPSLDAPERLTPEGSSLNSRGANAPRFVTCRAAFLGQPREGLSNPVRCSRWECVGSMSRYTDISCHMVP
jgi:hypothetical protein